MVMMITDIEPGKFYEDKKGRVRKVYYVGPFPDWKIGWHGPGGKRGRCDVQTFANWAEREVPKPENWGDKTIHDILRESHDEIAADRVMKGYEVFQDPDDGWWGYRVFFYKDDGKVGEIDLACDGWTEEDAEKDATQNAREQQWHQSQDRHRQS